ncbi:MAG TPA: aminoglycoside phosphotransferase [Gammaproteobacteria bacterium]|nr:aminoglycoside phosphotransferase [Gammaproteobacteria bacterium]
MDHRLKAIQQWLLNEVKLSKFDLKPASSDASFRRYFRVDTGTETFIVMDAPPEKEDCQPFVDIAKVLGQAGLNTPRIIAQDLEQGFLLLSDLGSRLFLDELNDDSVELLYGDALNSLQKLQKIPHNSLPLPNYSADLLQQEMMLFHDWFLKQHLAIELSKEERAVLFDAFETLTESALEQPQVWVHRDYHSRNLMVLDKESPGILDFQDAVIGPVTYDLVSLLRDCYIAWPRERVEAWVTTYYQNCDTDLGGVSGAQFLRWFDLMGVQRHLKAMGIFARLNIRDGKSGYLGDIPRTLAYVREVCGRYEELRRFGKLLGRIPE